MALYNDPTLKKRKCNRVWRRFAALALCKHHWTFNPIKSNLQTHLLPIKERRNTCFMQPSPHFSMCFLFSPSSCLEKDCYVQCGMNLGVWDSSLLFLYLNHWWERRRRAARGGLTQESGVFLEWEFKGTPRSLYKPPSIGTKRKLNLQGAALYTFYRGTFSH